MTVTEPPRISVVMRSYNDVDVIGATLAALERQTVRDFELWNFDSTSSDGTLDVIRRHNDAGRILLNDSRSYNPGRVLNEAVAKCRGGIVVFINSDATPSDERWLERLVAPLQDPRVAAAFGRQVARPRARSLFVKDTERAFGDGSVARGWVHFFSMANSAVRRDLALAMPFETRIQYSEDIEWSYRMRRAGHRIEYVPEAVAVHSHNYTLAQSFRRHRGEGAADAWIFRNGELRQSFVGYCLLPFGMEVLRDLGWAVRNRSADAVLHSIPLRAAQKWGRWEGFRDGRRAHGKH
ncbi:MAG: glycosyltransferase [Steroidobacteraceae bacterium]